MPAKGSPGMQVHCSRAAYYAEEGVRITVLKAWLRH